MSPPTPSSRRWNASSPGRALPDRRHRRAAGAGILVITCPPAPQRTFGGIPGPKGIAVDPDHGRIFVASYTADSLVVIDGAAQRIERTIPNIPSPNQVAYSPSLNRIYATNRNQNTLTVLNGATYATVATVPVGEKPFGVAVNPLTHSIYVANFDSARVDVVDGLTNTVVAGKYRSRHKRRRGGHWPTRHDEPGEV